MSGDTTPTRVQAVHTHDALVSGARVGLDLTGKARGLLPPKTLVPDGSRHPVSLYGCIRDGHGDSVRFKVSGHSPPDWVASIEHERRMTR